MLNNSRHKAIDFKSFAFGNKFKFMSRFETNFVMSSSEARLEIFVFIETLMELVDDKEA